VKGFAHHKNMVDEMWGKEGRWVEGEANGRKDSGLGEGIWWIQ